MVVVHSAAVQDRDGGDQVLSRMAGCFGRVVKIVKRSDTSGFVVLPKRWIVERTFAWLGRYRRLSKDYESLPASSETMIQLAMINLMLHRLQPG